MLACTQWADVVGLAIIALPIFGFWYLIIWLGLR